MLSDAVVPAALVTLSAAVAAGSPRVLAHRTWAQRSPRLGILAWQCAVGCVLSSLALLALTAALPVQRLSFDVGHLVHACGLSVHHHQALLVDGGWRLVCAVIAVATLLAVLGAALVRGRQVRRARQRQRAVLDLVALERDQMLGAHVLDSDVALAYCVPGGSGRVVVTTAALTALDERQLAAVLAHEHAHLDGRHDWVLFMADVAATAFPWLPFFRHARAQLRVLVEMAADDEAARRQDPLSLAAALAGLGQHAAPEGAVGATGDSVLRVERLIARRRRLSRLQRTAVVVGSGLLLLVPWLVALAPVVGSAVGRCPSP